MLLGSLSSAPIDGALPKLEIALDCGKCQVAPLTLQWMNEGFQAEAKTSPKNGLQAITVITIKGYSERGNLWKLAAGPFAMARSDEIRGTVLVRGQVIEVTDSRRLPMFGIDTVARAVGKQAYQALAK
jgi:hypothetical protein